ncbi:MAG: deoxyhypusine synthase family protein [Woeseiaceae bacterium]|nr:deoxyhypusine synthase family protein [Woeseiaceae bacterium]
MNSSTRFCCQGDLEKRYQIDPKDSWLLAAAKKDLPIIVPGWEDSTLGNIYASHCITGEISNVHTVRSGIEYMMMLADWYKDVCQKSSIGFFQIGGGIAGDFPICVVPMLEQDLRMTDIPRWGYFCQISDSTTSYGSYSGAVPNEKITWGKLVGRHAEVHHRVRRHNCRTIDLCLRHGAIAASGKRNASGTTAGVR